MGIENMLARGYNLPGLEMPLNLLAKKQELEGNQTRNLLAQMQVQQYMQQQQEAQKQRQALQAFQQSIPSPQMQASQAALSGGGGPTVANAAQMKPVDPRLQMAHGAMRAGLMNPMDYMNQAMPAPKAPEYKVVGGSLVQIGQDGVKEAYRAPEKSDTPSAVREYQFAQGQGYKGSFQDFQLAQKKAGATSVAVNTGQKGLDNTLKLRGDFRGEPVYKAHQEMQSAHSQIKQALGQANPVGDLAAATKIMKLLDPGSVVRESELGMAMAATGLLDRATNYAGSIVNGTKLTPKQRVEFQQLADALYRESVGQYNGKRKEYEGIAGRNGLNVVDVLGDPSAAPPMPLPRSVVRKPEAAQPSADDPLGLRGN